jgi:hypothetical protein
VVWEPLEGRETRRPRLPATVEVQPGYFDLAQIAAGRQ